MFALLTKKAFAQAPIQSEPQTGVITAITSSGHRIRVRFESTEWFAQSRQAFSFQPGDLVRVVGRLNATTLLIETNYS